MSAQKGLVSANKDWIEEKIAETTIALEFMNQSQRDSILNFVPSKETE